MLDWLKFWRRGRAEKTAQPQLATSPASEVLLWGPSYDSLTAYTSEWLLELGQAPRCRTMGPVLNRKDIVLALDGLNGARSMAIFFGHGIATALLGPPRAEETSVVSGQGTHSQIYDDDLVERGPNALFAFCCLVGRDLGPRFGKLSDRSFLGYDDYLPIDLMNEECVETWKSIVQRISKQLIQDKDIRDEHEMQLRRSYETALAYYNSGDGKDNQEHIEMQMYILRHLKALRRY